MSPRNRNSGPGNLESSRYDQKYQSDESKLPTWVGKFKKMAKSGKVGKSAQGIAQDVSNVGQLFKVNLIYGTRKFPIAASLMLFFIKTFVSFFIVETSSSINAFTSIGGRDQFSVENA